MITAVVGAGLIAGGYFLLSDQWNPVYAQRWTVLSAAVLSYELFILWRGLPRNHRKTEQQILSNLGLGNALTITRGLMLALIGGFLFSPWPGGWLAWAPGLLYTAAGVLDYLDGFAARVTQHATRLGEYLDLELDALGVLIAPLLAVLYGQLPVWYLAASAARYLFAFGIWRRKRRGLPVYELTPSVYRRHMAGFLMGLVGVVLWPVFFPPGTWAAATVYVIPFLALFVRDWLVVSGWMDPQSAGYGRWTVWMERFATRWLPIGMRLAALGIGGWIALAQMQAGTDLPGLWIGLIVVSILIALGIAGRIMALAMLGLIGFGFPPHEVDITSILIAAATGISLLGTGPASLWQPEDRYFISMRQV